MQEKFESLVETHFLQRCPKPRMVDDKVVAMEIQTEENDLYAIPVGKKLD